MPTGDVVVSPVPGVVALPVPGVVVPRVPGAVVPLPRDVVARRPGEAVRPVARGPAGVREPAFRPGRARPRVPAAPRN